MFYETGRSQTVSNKKSNYHALEQRSLYSVIENLGGRQKRTTVSAQQWQQGVGLFLLKVLF